MVFALAALTGIAPTAATTVTWDNQVDDGHWSNAVNWSDNIGPTTTSDVVFPFPVPGTSTIILEGTGQTFEVAGATLTFNASYTFTQGALAVFGSGGPITVNNTPVPVTATINSIIAGNHGLTKLGAGTLVLGGANNFTGSVFLNAGTTVVTADSNFGSTSNALTIQNGAVLNTLGFATSRAVTIGTGGGQINVTSSPSGFLVLLTGFTADANQFTAAGNGTLALNGASARTGPSLIQNGTVILNDASGLGSGTISVNSNGRLELAGGSIAVPINLGTTGTLTGSFSVATTYTGGPITVAAASTVNLRSFGASAPLTLGSATPNVYTGGAGATTVIDGFGGKVILATANDYAGDWRIDGGTLRLNNAAGLGSGTSAIVVNGTNFGNLELPGVTLGRAVTLNNNGTLIADNGANTTAPISVASGAAVTLSLKTGGIFTLGDSANDLTGGGNNASITVTSDNAGALLRLNQQSDFTGSWTIGQFGDAGAVVETSADSSLGNAANFVTVRSNATLRTTANFSMGHSIALSGALDIASGTTLTMSSSLQPNSGHKTGSGTLIAMGGVFGSGALEIDAGTVVLPTTSPFGSAINVNTATLEIANASVVNSVTLRDGSTLRGTGTAQTTGAVSVPAGASVTVATGASAGDTLTLGGGVALTGGGAATTINVAGSGRVIAAQPATYSGGWSVNAGTLAVTNETGLGTGAATVLSGSVIEVNDGGSDTFKFGNALNLNNGSAASDSTAILRISTARSRSRPAPTRRSP